MQTFELERMLSYHLNKDLDRQRLCHLKYVYIVTLTYLNLINHTDALTPSKSEITEIFHDQLRFVHRGVHEIFKTVET